MIQTRGEDIHNETARARREKLHNEAALVREEKPRNEASLVRGKALRRTRIHAGWILAVGIPLIIVLAGLFVFSKFLYGVEYYSPSVQLEKYVSLVSAGDYAGAMDFIGLKTTPFNRVEEYTAYFKDYYGGPVESSVFTERKLHRTEQSRFYDVQINKKAAQKFELTKTGEKRLFIFDSWKVKLVTAIPTKSVLIHTPPGVRILLNGTEVSDQYKLAESTYSPNYYKNVKDDNTKIKTQTYRIDGLVAISSVEAKTASGEKCEVSLLETETKTAGVPTYLAVLPIPADQVAGIKAITETITKKYAEFVAKDMSFEDFAPYLYKNTKLYTDLKEFYNGWFTGHQTYGFENVEFFGLQYFDDTHYAVGIKFKYFVTKSGQRYEYDVKYTVYLLKVGKLWLLADMSIA